MSLNEEMCICDECYKQMLVQVDINTELALIGWQQDWAGL